VLDHISLNVREYAASRRFYEAALAPLGATVIMEFPNICGFGVAGKPDFWVRERGEPSGPMHVAFETLDRNVVHACHEAALAAGGTDNGAPGPRPAYHEHYYGAFVLDPDGNNVEAVCHAPGP
jgi:catechol 2,3-dioxygenase-like lactoylglutathione lyase family enzyme